MFVLCYGNGWQYVVHKCKLLMILYNNLILKGDNYLAAQCGYNVGDTVRRIIAKLGTNWTNCGHVIATEDARGENVSKVSKSATSLWVSINVTNYTLLAYDTKIKFLLFERRYKRSSVFSRNVLILDKILKLIWLFAGFVIHKVVISVFYQFRSLFEKP